MKFKDMITLFCGLIFPPFFLHIPGDLEQNATLLKNHQILITLLTEAAGSKNSLLLIASEKMASGGLHSEILLGHAL